VAFCNSNAHFRFDTREYVVNAPMPLYAYAVWFRDLTMLPDDQDYEWVACIAIEAPTESEAQSWGDHLAHRRSQGATDAVFLHSSVKPIVKYDVRRDGPLVSAGMDVSDEVIGW
jgi:hypothetical protein